MSEDAVGTRSGGGVLRELVQVLALGLLLTLAGLWTWTVLPLALGWTPHVVTSGSMEPRIRVGDVIVSQPTSPDRVQVGQVVLARAGWTGGKVVAHRAVELRADGAIETRGDANQGVDPEPVEPSAEVAVARLRVPTVGLPFVWAAQGQVWRVVVVLATVGWVTLLATGPAAPDRSRRRRSRARGLSRR